MESEQVSVATKCLHFVMTERSLRTHFASILGFRPFLGSLGAAEGAFEYESLFGHVYPFVSIDIF
jgi:hypothetical protein